MVDPEHRRRRGAVALAVIGVLLATAIGVGYERREDWMPAPEGRRVRVVPASRSASERPPAPAAIAAPPAGVAVCGGARIARQPDGTPDPAAYRAAIGLPQTVALTLNALHGDGNDRSQAAAAMLSQAYAPDDRPALAIQDVLAGLAATTSDADVYAWAYGRCGPPPAARANASCALLNARRWTELDPDNAAAWLAAADEARLDGNTAAAVDAIRHAAHAGRNDGGEDWLMATVLAHVPSGDAHALAAVEIATTVVGIQRAQPAVASPAARVHCSRDAMADDAERRTLCSRLAGVLVDRSTALIDVVAGARIGEAAGWSPDRVDAVLGEVRAFGAAEAAASQHAWSAGTTRHDCASAAAQRTWFDRLARGSETERMHAWATDAGKAADDFIAIGRASRAASPASGS